MQRLLAVLVLCFVAPACRDKASDAPSGVAASERYRVRGKIVGLSKQVVDIHHEQVPAIRGFDGTVKPMASMTMSFGRNGTSFAGLGAGDLVEIVFTVHYDSDPTLRLIEITKLPSSTALDLH